MNLTFFGILANGVGSLILLITPLEAGYGGKLVPKSNPRWILGWALQLVGFTLQAIGAYSR